jgi:hypothetical protein
MELNELNKKIDELEGQLNVSDSYVPNIEIVNVDNVLEQLEAVRESNILIQVPSTDEEREAKNKETALENKLRLQLGLQPKGYFILDKDLELLIALDSGSMGRSCKEFISKFQEDKGLMKELEFRVNELVNIRIAEQDRETARLNFLADSAYKLEQLGKYRPEQFTHARNQKNEVVIVDNPAYAVWKKDILELSAKINNQIKAVNSISQEFPEETPDRRESLFKLQKKIDALIEQHQLKVVN